jgi:hypothetical protein
MSFVSQERLSENVQQNEFDTLILQLSILRGGTVCNKLYVRIYNTTEL